MSALLYITLWDKYMNATGITVKPEDITLINFKQAESGTGNNPSGINGSLTFTVTLKKGNVEMETTKEIPVIIVATHYVTSVDVISKSKPLNVWIQDGVLNISGLTAGKPWSVYNISGALVYNSIAGMENESTFLRISRGVYIVKSGNSTVKILY